MRRRADDSSRIVPRSSRPAGLRKPAVEPPLPVDVSSTEELYLTGLHLAQYHHATRHAEDYWEEALRRQPEDARSNTAMGWSCLHRGEFRVAIRPF